MAPTDLLILTRGGGERVYVKDYSISTQSKAQGKDSCWGRQPQGSKKQEASSPGLLHHWDIRLALNISSCLDALEGARPMHKTISMSCPQCLASSFSQERDGGGEEWRGREEMRREDRKGEAERENTTMSISTLKNLNAPSIMLHTCNAITWKTEAGGLGRWWVWASLGYITKPCLLPPPKRNEGIEDERKEKWSKTPQCHLIKSFPAHLQLTLDLAISKWTWGCCYGSGWADVVFWLGEWVQVSYMLRKPSWCPTCSFGSATHSPYTVSTPSILEDFPHWSCQCCTL